MKRALRLSGFVLLAIITWFILLVIAIGAFAHSVTLDDGSEFFFAPYCCDQRDCQEVPLSAITPKGDGWAVDYMTKDGKHVRDFFKEGAVGQKWSPNHQVFACHSFMMNPDGTYKARCIYPQKPGM